MAVKAVNMAWHIRSMKGRCSPHLVIADNGVIYVIKNGPPRQTVSEYVYSRLAQLFNLPVPECALVSIPQFLMDGTPELAGNYSGRTSYVSTHYFGSRFVGANEVGTTMDCLPALRLKDLCNAEDFTRALFFDRWCGNIGQRQVVFHREACARRYTALFIGHSNCFDWQSGQLAGLPYNPLINTYNVYTSPNNDDVLRDCISRLAGFSRESFIKIIDELPYGLRSTEEESVLKVADQLLLLRGYILRECPTSSHHSPIGGVSVGSRMLEAASSPIFIPGSGY
jgi:hypothetical protein